MRIGIIGDIHGCWDEKDNAYFEQAPIDLLLFTGDLALYVGTETFRIAEIIARLSRPFALIAGNHDCVPIASLVGELTHIDAFSRLQARTTWRRYERLRMLLGDRLVGYSSLDAVPFTIVGARPFAMDGARLSFAGPLQRIFGISTLAESATRLNDLIATAPNPVIVLAHNGPHGLGSDAHAPFGIDFRSTAGDNGDHDLASALKGNSAKIKLVVAGHMHHKVKGSAVPRRYSATEDGVAIVNGARVPRHSRGLGFYFAIEVTEESTGQPVPIWYDRATGRVVERPVPKATSDVEA